MLPKAHVQLQVQIQLAYEHIHHLELRVYLHQDVLAAVGVLPGFRPAGEGVRVQPAERNAAVIGGHGHVGADAVARGGVGIVQVQVRGGLRGEDHAPAFLIEGGFRHRALQIGARGEGAALPLAWGSRQGQCPQGRAHQSHHGQAGGHHGPGAAALYHGLRLAPLLVGEGLPLRALQPQLFKGLVPDGAFPHRGGGDVPQALGIGAGQQAFQISHHASSFFKVFRSFSRPRFRRLFTVEGFMPSSSAMRATVCRQ